MKFFIGAVLIANSFILFGQGYSVMQLDIRSDTFNVVQRFKYIEHILPVDTLCASAVKKALREVADTLHFVVVDRVFGQGLRYEDELKLLVEQQGLKFDFIFGNDVFYEIRQMAATRILWIRNYLKNLDGTLRSVYIGRHIVCI